MSCIKDLQSSSVLFLQQISSPSLGVPNNSLMDESSVSDDIYSTIMGPELAYFHQSQDSGVNLDHSTDVQRMRPSHSRLSLRPSSVEGRYDTYHSATQLHTSLNSSDASCADSTPLGKRPPCIGKESTPIGKNLFKIISSFGISPKIGNPNWSELDSGWDNSDLDATCSTCGINSTSYQEEYVYHNNSSKALPQVKFMRHMRLCQVCIDGDLCPTAFRLRKRSAKLL